MNTEETKVVSLTQFKKDVKNESTVQDLTNQPSEEGDSFEDAMRKNALNKMRLKQERLKANKSVLRSYRIKN